MNRLTGLFAAIDISSSGLAAQRRRMNHISENLANIHTTNTPEGGPYRRKISRFHELVKNTTLYGEVRERMPMQTTRSGHLQSPSEPGFDSRFSGVQIEMVRSKAAPSRVWDPEHPDANAEGFVMMPKISVVSEMVDMISATRAYEANVTAIKASKDMARKALEI